MRNPRTAAITTPSCDPIRPSDTADRASPPVMDPTDDQPTCSTTFKPAMTLDGHHPIEYREMETWRRPVGAPMVAHQPYTSPTHLFLSNQCTHSALATTREQKGIEKKKKEKKLYRDGAPQQRGKNDDENVLQEVEAKLSSLNPSVEATQKQSGAHSQLEHGGLI